MYNLLQVIMLSILKICSVTVHYLSKNTHFHQKRTKTKYVNIFAIPKAQLSICKYKTGGDTPTCF